MGRSPRSGGNPDGYGALSKRESCKLGFNLVREELGENDFDRTLGKAVTPEGTSSGDKGFHNSIC